MRLLEESGLAEIEIEEDNRRVRLSKGASGAPAPMYHYAPQAESAPAAPDKSAKAEPEPADDDAPEYAHTIDSPMVGTFYSSPSPGEPPFVAVGTRIDADSTVCIVEAMKIMNEVTAKENCIIEAMLVENGEPVEFGQPLFAIRPVA